MKTPKERKTCICGEMMIISALFVAVLLRDSNFILGIEKEPEATEDATPPSRIFAEWMDEYEVYIKENKKLSPSYCKNVHSTANIVKSYLRHIHRPRMLLAKVDKSFYKNLLPYMKDVYKNTKSPDAPMALSKKTLLLIQTNLVSHQPPHLRYDDPHSRGQHLHDK